MKEIQYDQSKIQLSIHLLFLIIMPFFVQCSDSSTSTFSPITTTEFNNETMGNDSTTTTTTPVNTTLEITTTIITTQIYGNNNDDNDDDPKDQKTFKLGTSCRSGSYNCPVLCDYLNFSPEEEPSTSVGYYVVIIVLIAMLIVIGVILYKIPKTILESRTKKKTAATPVSQCRSVQVSKPLPKSYIGMKSVKPPSMSSTPSESITPEPARSAITPNTTKINEGAVSVRTKLLRLRDHVEKMQKQEESDGRSDKFEKKGPIVMHLKGIDVIPEEVPEEEVVLTKVYYDPKGNEQYDIGSDIDILGSELGSKKEKKVEKLKSGSDMTKKPPEGDSKSGI